MDCGPIPRARGTAGRSAHVPLVIREPEESWWEVHARPSVTVAAVHEGDAGWSPEAMVARVAELADGEQLLLIFGAGSRTVHHSLIAELRHRLPRRQVVTMLVRHRHRELLRDAATVERLLDAGSLPVVITPVSALLDLTAEIASYLRADRVLRVLRTAGGAELYPVWERLGAQPQPAVS